MAPVKQDLSRGPPEINPVSCNKINGTNFLAPDAHFDNT